MNTIKIRFHLYKENFLIAEVPQSSNLDLHFFK